MNVIHFVAGLLSQRCDQFLPLFLRHRVFFAGHIREGEDLRRDAVFWILRWIGDHVAVLIDEFDRLADYFLGLADHSRKDVGGDFLLRLGRESR